MSEYYFRISELINKVRLGLASEEEKKELEEWLNREKFHREVYERILGRRELQKEYDTYKALSSRKVWDRIVRQRRRKKYMHMIRWSVAALALIGVGLGAYFISGNKPMPSVSLTEGINYDSIRSGERKAILELANGQKITLRNTDMQLQTGIAVVRQTDQVLKYVADSIPAEEKRNVLTTPRGGEFTVVLADGTRVWLNAASRLVFPEVFVKGVRRVELIGEAYFEVAPDAEKPFVVTTPQVEVKVLGTHFNIKSFPEEKRTITTLAEGSVALSAAGKSVILQPDQQGEYVEGQEKWKVKNVDATDYTAWKEGKFVFRRERLETIMEDIIRWYNIEVFYQNQQVKDLVFSGKMDRYGNIKELLEMLEKTGKVKFELGNGGLIVKAK